MSTNTPTATEQNLAYAIRELRFITEERDSLKQESMENKRQADGYYNEAAIAYDKLRTAEQQLAASREAVIEECAKVCDEIKKGAHRDYERHLAANGGKFRYGSGDPANFSNAREADFSMAAERIRALSASAAKEGK